MTIYYEKGEQTDIKLVNYNHLVIIFEKVEDINLSPGELIAKIITNHPLTSFYGYDEKSICELLYCILKGDKKLIPNFCSRKVEPFSNMNSHYIKKLMDAYKILLKKDENSVIVIETNNDSFLDYINYISNLDGNYIIYSRTITLSDYYTFLKDINLDNYNNIMIDYQDNTSPVDIKTLFDIASVTKEVIDITTYNNLSTLEQIIYVYDVLKKREYKDDKEDYLSSRDIDKVLKGDKIVCLGYANIFSAVLSSLGINNMVVKNIKGKHARNIAHVIDDKYDIDSILFFDVTWDSKKKDDISYLNKYYCFGMTTYDASLRMKEKLNDVLDMDFNEIVRLVSYEDIRNGDYDIIRIIEDSFELYKKGSYNKFMNYIFDNKMEPASEMYNNYISKYRKELDMPSFAKALYRVREVEEENGIISEFDLVDIKNSILHKYIHSLLVKCKKLKIGEKRKKDLELDIYLEMCLDVIPLLDRLEKESSKIRTRRKDECHGKD